MSVNEGPASFKPGTEVEATIRDLALCVKALASAHGLGSDSAAVVAAYRKVIGETQRPVSALPSPERER